MQQLVVPISVAVALSLSSAAWAGTYEVRFSGELISQTNSGVDPYLAIGDRLDFVGHFDSSQLVDWGGTGYSVASVIWTYRIDTASGVYFQGGDRFDGAFPFFELDHYYGDGSNLVINNLAVAGPAVILKGGQVAGLAGIAEPGHSAPFIDYGSSFKGWSFKYNDLNGGPLFVDEYFGPLNLSDTFTLTQPEEFFYNNTYVTPGFKGHWDFAGGVVTLDGKVVPVPEPGAWALLIAGFGLVGAALRRGRAMRPS